MSRPDICTRENIDALLREFYAEAMADAVIGYLFTDVAKLDLEAHLPVIGAFWETVLLDRPVYRGNPMRLHQALHAASALRAEHFQRWFRDMGSDDRRTIRRPRGHGRQTSRCCHRRDHAAPPRHRVEPGGVRTLVP